MSSVHTLPEVATPKRASPRREPFEWRPIAFATPAILILVVMVIYPTIFAISTSLHDFNPMLPDVIRYVGLRNFTRAFNDPLFVSTIWRTAVFIVSAVTLEFVLGFALALVVFYLIPIGGTFVRFALTVPMIMPSVAIGLVWRWLYDGQFGLINYLLGLFGIPPHLWLGDPTTAMGAVILVEVWQWMPFVFLCLYAGLASLPGEPVEAALVDGAGPLQLLRYVIVPMLKPIILVVLLFRIIDSMRVFDIIFVLTEGGPSESTIVYPFFIYMQGFRYYKIGYASALSWLMVVAVTVLAVVLIRMIAGRAGEMARS
jgi:multiple sugar transport system permease protein